MVRFVWLLVGFSAGVVVGWAVTLQFSPEWVGAVGTCVGAVGTIATILWAVHTFQRQTADRIAATAQERSNQPQREQVQAQGFLVRVMGGGGSGHAGQMEMTNVNVEIINGCPHAVTLRSIRLPGMALLRLETVLGLPLLVTADTVLPQKQVPVEPIVVPDDQFSGRPLKFSTPVFEYEAAGVGWERTGNGPPLRLV